MLNYPSPKLIANANFKDLCELLISNSKGKYREQKTLEILLAFAGLESSTYQSGKFEPNHAVMVKRGSRYLRWALMQAAHTVCLRDITFKNFRNKKRAEGKHYFVAMSHVAKKLLRIIFSFTAK